MNRITIVAVLFLLAQHSAYCQQAGDSSFTKKDSVAFTNGDTAWSAYLIKSITKENISRKIPTGTYTVIVRFIVAKDGSISDVIAETKNGWNLESEIIRGVKKGPRWTPAQKNGKNVNRYRRVTFTFIVQSKRQVRKLKKANEVVSCDMFCYLIVK